MAQICVLLHAFACLCQEPENHILTMKLVEIRATLRALQSHNWLISSQMPTHVTVRWNYPNFTQPEGAVFRLLVKTPETRPEHYYCVCINGTLSLTEHSLIVKYDPVNPVSDKNFVEASIVTFPHRSSRERFI